MFCQLAPLDGLNKRKSVEPFVYCVGGSDKTQKQINSTPHLTVYVFSTYTAQVMSVIAYPCFFETVRFPTLDKSETLSHHIVAICDIAKIIKFPLKQ